MSYKSEELCLEYLDNAIKELSELRKNLKKQKNNLKDECLDEMRGIFMRTCVACENIVFEYK
jgi:hypothetical protein